MRLRVATPYLCLATFAAGWVLLAIAPWDRATWMLENIPTLIAVPLAVATFRRFRFSDRAYVHATIFLLLHTLGSHYTYSTTPIGDWMRAMLGLGRNHYDRVVHFSFGLLMLAPSRERFFRPPAVVPVDRQVGLSIALIAAWGCGYEILEWLIAIVADPTAGIAFLGTQGDPWDSQKDLLAAVAGALVGAIIEVRFLRRTRRHNVDPQAPSAADTSGPVTCTALEVQPSAKPRAPSDLHFARWPFSRFDILAEYVTRARRRRTSSAPESDQRAPVRSSFTRQR